MVVFRVRKVGFLSKMLDQKFYQKCLRLMQKREVSQKQSQILQTFLFLAGNDPFFGFGKHFHSQASSTT